MAASAAIMTGSTGHKVSSRSKLNTKGSIVAENSFIEK